MSFQSLADAFAYVQTHDDLTSSEVLVLTAIAHHADRTGGNAYPTQPTLEKFTKLTARTIRSTLRSLEAKKLLETTLVAYPMPADNVSRLPPSRLSRVNQPVISTRTRFARPRSCLLPCL